MPVNTSSLTVVTQSIYDLLTTNKAALGLTDVWYGDQKKIPRTPAIAVESGMVERELAGVGRQGRTLNTFTIFVLCYIGKLDDNQNTRKIADQLAEQVEVTLNTDATLDGTVIHGYVVRIEPGYSTRQGELFRVARLTYQGITKTAI